MDPQDPSQPEPDEGLSAFTLFCWLLLGLEFYAIMGILIVRAL